MTLAEHVTQVALGLDGLALLMSEESRDIPERYIRSVQMHASDLRKAMEATTGTTEAWTLSDVMDRLEDIERAVTQVNYK